MAREFDKRQAHVAYKERVATKIRRRLKAGATHRRDQIILIDTVAADANGADQLTAFVERHTAGKDLNAVFKRRDPRAVIRAGHSRHQEFLHLGRNQIEWQPDIERAEDVNRYGKRSRRGAVEPIGEERSA